MNRNTIPLEAIANAFGPVSQAPVPARSGQGVLWQCARSLWERVLQFRQRAPRRLRLCESLPLGERRFVAVVEFESIRFLVGGTPTSLVLLARLEKLDREIDQPATESTHRANGAPN